MIVSPQTPLRVPPSGPLAPDVDVTGWTLWRSLADLPDPDGFGIRWVPQGGYQQVNDINLPVDEQIRLYDDGSDPTYPQGHRIVGNGCRLTRLGAAGGPALYVDTTATSRHDVLIEGLRFRQIGGIMAAVGNSYDEHCVFLGCEFDVYDVGLQCEGLGVVECIGCEFADGTNGVVVNSAHEHVGIHACRFDAGTMHMRLLDKDAFVDVVGSRFANATTGIEAGRVRRLQVVASGFAGMTNGIDWVSTSAEAYSFAVHACHFTALATGVLKNATAPSLGGSLVGCTGDNFGSLTNYTKAEIFIRACHANGVPLSETVITP